MVILTVEREIWSVGRTGQGLVEIGKHDPFPSLHIFNMFCSLPLTFFLNKNFDLIGLLVGARESTYNTNECARPHLVSHSSFVSMAIFST